MFIKSVKKLPRMATIPGITIEAYRALQVGEAVDVDTETGEYLIRLGYAELGEEG